MRYLPSVEPPDRDDAGAGVVSAMSPLSPAELFDLRDMAEELATVQGVVRKHSFDCL